MRVAEVPGRAVSVAVMLLAAGAGSLAAQAPAAPPPQEVTLPEAIRRALEVEPAVVQARGDVRNAAVGERAAWGAFLPTISAGGASSQASANRYNQATGQIVTVPTGSSYSGSVALSLDLFDGFRRFANRGAAAATADAAAAGLVSQRYQVILETEQAFDSASASEELVRVAEAQLKRAGQQLQMVTDKLHAGSATRSDSLRAAVDLGNARLSLLQAQANLATAQASLGRRIGVEAAVRAVPDTALLAFPDTTGVRAEAMSRSPQVQQAEAQAKAAQAQVSAARSQYWPTLSASYRNGYTGFDAPWSTTQSYVNNWTLQFSLSWTLFNGFTREASQVAASVQRDVANAQAADLRRQTNAQLTQQLAALTTAAAQMDISRANVAAASEDLRVQQQRYRVGVATILDLLTSEANLTQAEVSLVQARFGYLLARARLEALVGRSL